MALSNLLNEPRRELTESAVGILVGGGVLGLWTWGDYCLAAEMAKETATQPGGPCPIPLGMCLGLIITLVVLVFGWGFLMMTHALGDWLCGVVERHGLQLRPRRRRASPPNSN